MTHNPYDWSNIKKPPYLQIHSIAKHKMIQAYVERYIKALASISRHDELKISIVDGFSGGGLYRRMGTEELCFGSPFIFLETIRKMEASIRSQRKKKFGINATYYFMDRDASAITFLRSQLQKNGYSKLIGERIFLLTGSFRNLFAGTMEIIGSRNSHVLVLLDQYGYKDAPLALIRKTFKHHPTAEVILTFAVDALVNYIADRRQFHKCIWNLDPTGRILSTNDIKEITVLKKRINSSKKVEDWRWIIERKILKRLVRICGAKYYLPYFIVSRKSHRTYWLLHLSMSLKAKNEMLKLHGEKHNCFIRHGVSGPKMYGFDPRLGVLALRGTPAYAPVN